MYPRKERFKGYDDESLLELMQSSNDHLAFEEIYLRYFVAVYNKAYEKLRDRFLAQEVTQTVFVSIWQSRHSIILQTNLQNYLFGMVKYQVITQIRKKLIQEKYFIVNESPAQEAAFTNHLTSSFAVNLTEETIAYESLKNDYQKALSFLPDKCREVFLLSRVGTNNKEIASRLNISEKTVEQHITKAIRLLRVHLKDYAVVCILGFFIKF
ncbi:sigma-70 family RNA polymerase sigma factor [Flectobacillus major]|jgi:RNA polymerase sigma-70 factor (ECF subfamily)|uniref:sigma-70 family RNA polymerase sigma factor n=1 Tax=Flectobacillus major TaxID=103 RepID=UPI000413CEE7|nr:sigma-70 family RNA polymerase sigma factor [Flectobacillus major]